MDPVGNAGIPFVMGWFFSLKKHGGEIRMVKNLDNFSVAKDGIPPMFKGKSWKSWNSKTARNLGPPEQSSSWWFQPT